MFKTHCKHINTAITINANHNHSVELDKTFANHTVEHAKNFTYSIAMHVAPTNIRN